MLKKRALVLMYHNIAEPPQGDRLRSLYVTPGMFSFQMWYLKKAGFRVVPLEDILAFARGERDDDRMVSLTFDDGYEDFILNAFPVLKRYGYPSTVFIVSEMVGRDNLWDCDNMKTRKRLMSWEQMAGLRGGGVAFGSHTKTHPFLSKLEDRDVICEVRDSRTLLEERLGQPVDFFCYPYGDYDTRTVEALKRAGYHGALTTQRGFVHRGDDPYEIRRSFIRLNTHPLLFAYKLHSLYEDRKGGRL